MIDTTHLLKVTAAWVSIVYVVCFGGVALAPGIREWFMQYALHATNVGIGENVMTLSTFIAGLIIWNIVAALAVWIFAFLWNAFKRS
jgi:hypothetical protein